MEQMKFPPIRPMVPSDIDMVNAFFDQMGGRTRAMFNRGDGQRRGVLACLDPERYGEFSYGVRRNFIAVETMDDGTERIVGLVFLWELDSKIPTLGIGVAEDWKGRRLGRHLISYAKQYCMDQGKGGILLSTHVANFEGQGLYHSTGFKHIGSALDGEMLFLLSFPDTPPAEDGTV